VTGRLMLIDSASLYFRAYFGVKETFLAPDGTPVNAVRGFLDMIATLVTARRPDRLVACWDDDWRPAFRVRAIPSYKAHRLAANGANQEQSPPELDVQVPVIVELLVALGVARVGVPGYEADDVIGTLVTRAVADGPGDIEVVTGDRDLFQLVDDAAGVRVLYTGKGVRNLEVIDQARLMVRYGVGTGQGYADMAALRGDPSDGLPGVPGVGEKTAVGLVSRYGSLAALRAAAAAADPGLSAGQISKLQAASDYLDVAPTVVQVARDAPVAEHDDTLPITPPDPDLLLATAVRWGVESSVARVLKAFSGP
jgi:5'-3' exonuclease